MLTRLNIRILAQDMYMYISHAPKYAFLTHCQRQLLPAVTRECCK